MPTFGAPIAEVSAPFATGERALGSDEPDRWSVVSDTCSLRAATPDSGTSGTPASFGDPESPFARSNVATPFACTATGPFETLLGLTLPGDPEPEPALIIAACAAAAFARLDAVPCSSLLPGAVIGVVGVGIGAPSRGVDVADGAGELFPRDVLGRTRRPPEVVVVLLFEGVSPVVPVPAVPAPLTRRTL